MNRGINMSVRYVMLICLPAAIGLTVMGGPVVRILFGASDIAERMTEMGSLWVATYSLSTVTNAVLQGCGHMELPVRHAAISLAVHVAALAAFLIVFKMGIYAMPISGIVFSLSMCLLNAASIRRVAAHTPDIRRSYVLPAVCSIVMGAAVLILRLILQKSGCGSFMLCFICIGCAVVVYGVLVIVTGCFSLSDFKRRKS